MLVPLPLRRPWIYQLILAARQCVLTDFYHRLIWIA